MKTGLILLSLLTCSLIAAAQTREEIVIGRAKEFQRAFTQDDKQLWRKFIKENYTKAFIERPMKTQIAGEGGTKSTTIENKADPIEGKLAMFERLHEDLPGARIGSVTPTGDEVEMVLHTGNQMIATFKFRFDKSAPYLIDGIGVEIGDR